MKFNLQLGAALLLASSMLSSCWAVNSQKDFDALVEEARRLAEEEDARKQAAQAAGGGGSGICSGSYVSPTTDGQLNGYCGSAYQFRCNQGLELSDQYVQAVCQYYNDYREPGVADCPYCK
jgi:hypothetical protein